MKANEANKDINGWSVISKWLNIKGKKQGDLAALLDITASAVSQIKSGIILLNAKQIRAILNYLEIDSRDMCALYTLIFNARLNNASGQKQRLDQKLIVNIADSSKGTDLSVCSEVEDSALDYRGSLCSVPLMTISQAMNYEPALESIESFAGYCSEKTATFPNAQAGSFALLVDKENATAEFSHSAVLLVAGGEYPVEGDMVVAKLRTGKVVTKYYSRDEDVICLKSKGSEEDNFTWRYKDDPGYVQWMYPVIEASLKLRVEDYKLPQ